MCFAYITCYLAHLSPSLPPTFFGKLSFHTLFHSVVLTGALVVGCGLAAMVTALAEEIAALLCHFLYSIYPPILQLG